MDTIELREGLMEDTVSHASAMAMQAHATKWLENAW